MPDISDITLDLTGWELASEEATSRVWYNEHGDALSVHFYGLPPDLPAPVSDLDALRSFYRQSMTQAGGAMVEVDPVAIDGCDALRTVVKAPQDPTGMTYLGGVTLPFASFSYVVKVQCPETGHTGFRESIVMAKLNPDFDEETGRAIGWWADPYDPGYEAPLLRNRADDAEWDDEAPDHPLSRCRRHLRQILETVSLPASVRTAPPFTGPRPKRRWWPFGKKR